MIEAVASPPPENVSYRLSSAFVANSSLNAAVLTFGTGTFVSARKTRRIPSVKRILRRMSGARRAVPTVSSNSALRRVGGGLVDVGRWDGLSVTRLGR
jgi:hypothetical protein